MGLTVVLAGRKNKNLLLVMLGILTGLISYSGCSLMLVGIIPKQKKV